MLKVEHPDAVESLLSLSQAAESAATAPVSSHTRSGHSLGTLNGSYPSAGQPLSTSVGTGGKHHRRLSSTGKSRRRLSDAQNAANRPSPSALLASLSLSSSPPLKSGPQISGSLTAASKHINQAGATHSPGSSGDFSGGVSQPNNENDSSVPSSTAPIAIGNGRNGKKRGVDHRCESCSKVYRHPSCLIKHRWEHTPHWREASKFVLSKHQQVQLLEAAAILSHLGQPAASSLPEDRSLWPSFLSGGSLPKADEVPSALDGSHSLGANSTISANGTVPSSYPTHPISSSVPAGPRLHNYSIPTVTASGGITQLRPGVIGVANADATDSAPSSVTAPQAIPSHRSHSHSHSLSSSDAFRTYRDTTVSGDALSTSWASASSYSHSLSHHTPSSYLSNGGFGGGAGWSLPRSSVRSSGSDDNDNDHDHEMGRLGLGSRSASASDDDESVVDAELSGLAGNGMTITGGYAPSGGKPIGIRGSSVVSVGVGRRVWKRDDDDDGMSIGYSVKEEDESSDVELEDEHTTKKAMNATTAATPGWDGLEMDMDMD